MVVKKTDNDGDVETGEAKGRSFTVGAETGSERTGAELEGHYDVTGEEENDEADASGEADGEEQDASDDADPSDEGGNDEAAAGDAEATEDLGEFKAADADKWKTAYQTEDGKLNFDKLSQEFWGNAKKDSPGSLHEGTYAYLESLGIPKDKAQSIEKALVVQANSKQKDIYDKAGGQSAVEAAMAWAWKDGGYTKAQQDNFVKAQKSGDETAISEALELLVSRHKAAGPQPKRKAKETQGMGQNGKDSGTSSGVQPYKDDAEREAAAKSIRSERSVSTREKLWSQHMQRVAVGKKGGK